MQTLLLSVLSGISPALLWESQCHPLGWSPQQQVAPLNTCLEPSNIPPLSLCLGLHRQAVDVTRPFPTVAL